ncbi:MAG: cell envelope integrity protein CreD [Balneolaceae bacterium]|nr:cell envelope integrity protein CreD [Balneolaceae bacterium]MBO6546566.1 cell envelope integrity protein CreD [Balneolaceae bacterium]MBO6648925.1 cell envelope integrity protein CreD [Balneolaceae bacterium]
MSNQEELPKTPFGQKHALFIKLSFISAITLILLIPSAMIKGLITERKQTKSEAVAEIGEKWGKEQIITGPVLTIPYKDHLVLKNSDTEHVEIIERVKQLHILPESLFVNSKIIPQRLHRGIFEVAVYDSQTTFEGNFANFDPLTLDINPENLLLDKAFLSIGVSDMRGIQKQVQIAWDEKSISFQSGTEISNRELLGSGIHAPVVVSMDGNTMNTSKFLLNLELKGSDHVYFTPVGKTTHIQMASSWTSPSFSGEYLPETEGKIINDDGFKASWNIIDLNRDFPQAWTNQKQNIKASAFGVNLFIPADNYQRSERSIKYAILFIGLTFLVFFFVEIMNKRAVHPLQYILVGLALCLFYTLLLSISEHSSFNFAYILSAGMTLALVGGYTRAILKNTHFTLLLSGVLAMLYGFIFVVIQLEDLALLTGSLGLFLILGLVMYFSRKIDWYSLNEKMVASYS